MYSLFKTATTMDNQTNNNVNTNFVKTTIGMIDFDEEFVVDNSNNNDDCDAATGTCSVTGCRLRFNSEAENDGTDENVAATTEEEEEDTTVTPDETTTDLLNENDEDEANSKTKIYILSIDGIPFYYEPLLKDARNQLLNIANYYVGKLNSNNGLGHIIVSDNNLRQVKIVAPYTFLFLTYNHVIHELTLDYATKLQ